MVLDIISETLLSLLDSLDLITIHISLRSPYVFYNFFFHNTQYATRNPPKKICSEIVIPFQTQQVQQQKQVELHTVISLCSLK